MVYPLTEVSAGCRPAWDGRVAVPTVLDGDLFEYFSPSPIAPDPKMAGEHYPVGRTLNLSTGLDINNYDEYMGTEFLHPYFDYRPQHCWAVGYIERPLTPIYRCRNGTAVTWNGSACGRRSPRHSGMGSYYEHHEHNCPGRCRRSLADALSGKALGDAGWGIDRAGT